MQKNIYILHEGTPRNNDNKLIKLLIEDLKNKCSEINTDMLDYHPMGTKSNFFKKEKYPPLLIQSVELGIVKKILFIIDADNNVDNEKYGGYENTYSELNAMIAELGFQAVSSIYIMCDPITKMGYLESFILSTIPEQQKNCIERFLECSQFKSKENHKAILNQIYNMAYPNAPYDFKHPHFEVLKEKLRNLFVDNL